MKFFADKRNCDSKVGVDCRLIFFLFLLANVSSSRDESVNVGNILVPFFFKLFVLKTISSRDLFRIGEYNTNSFEIDSFL